MAIPLDAYSSYIKKVIGKHDDGAMTSDRLTEHLALTLGSLEAAYPGKCDEVLTSGTAQSVVGIETKQSSLPSFQYFPDKPPVGVSNGTPRPAPPFLVTKGSKRGRWRHRRR